MDMIAPPTPSDPGQYLTENTAAFVANLVALRDELAKRQGALSAVEATARLRQDAQLALENAREQAQQLIEDATAKLTAVKKRESDVKDKARALDQARVAFEADQATTRKALEANAQANVAKAEELAGLEMRLALRETALATAQAELDEKVRALQAKVAALAL